MEFAFIVIAALWLSCVAGVVVLFREADDA
jgi:hypothetical protein